MLFAPFVFAILLTAAIIVDRKKIKAIEAENQEQKIEEVKNENKEENQEDNNV